MKNAQVLRPVATGCLLFDSVTDARCRAYYSTDGLLATTGITYKKAGNVHNAVVFCLKFLWAEHEKATRERCWFDIDNMVKAVEAVPE